MKKIALIMALIGFVGCTVTTEKKQESKRQIDNAIASPFKDLNIIKEKIPEKLREALANPYALPPHEMTCEYIQQEIKNLDDVLAPDVDAVKDKEENTGDELTIAADELGQASVDAIRRITEGLVPYRSWVRKLSGAERTSKLVAASIRAGNLRRAFLKGFRTTKCEYDESVGHG